VDLDRGEQEAIALAEELAADLLLVDEWDARLEAERRHLHVVGTLPMLADGASRGLMDLEESFDRLRHTSFRVNPELLALSVQGPPYRPGFPKSSFQPIGCHVTRATNTANRMPSRN
jgi:hypothetical protein